MRRVARRNHAHLLLDTYSCKRGDSELNDVRAGEKMFMSIIVSNGYVRSSRKRTANTPQCQKGMFFIPILVPALAEINYAWRQTFTLSVTIGADARGRRKLPLIASQHAADRRQGKQVGIMFAHAQEAHTNGLSHQIFPFQGNKLQLAPEYVSYTTG